MLFFHATLTLFLLAVFYFDLTRYIIPNWICGVLLALYPAMLFINPALPENYSILWSVGVCLMVFVAGLAIFALKLAGGGDVKLLAVLVLWTGREATYEFLFFTAMLGGLLAFALLLLRPIVAKLVPLSKSESIPRVLCHNQPLPYGLAIVVAFGMLLWTGKLPGLPVPWM
jgi:prepilin peptidase CpaA